MSAGGVATSTTSADLTRVLTAGASYVETASAEGPVLDTLKALEGPFDLVFVDADKENLTAYYEAVLPLLSPNGVIAMNKVLWFGRVLDPQNASDRGVTAFNDHVSKDDRVTQVILSAAGDGMMLIRPG